MLVVVAAVACSILACCAAMAFWTALGRARDERKHPPEGKISMRVAALEAQLTSYRAEVLDVVDRYERFAARWQKRAQRAELEEPEEEADELDPESEEGRRELRARILRGET